MTVVRVVNNYLDPLISPNGVLLANTDIVFQLVDVTKRQAAALFDALDGSYVVGNPVTATTDGAAYFTVNLWPNSRGEYATCYKVTLPNTNFKPVYIQVTEGEGDLTFLAARTNMEAMTPQTETIFGALLASITQALGTATSPVTDTTNGLMTYGEHLRLANTSGNNSGTNTGDETLASIKSKLGITTLSGDNTGDETGAGIRAKLSIPSDQDLTVLVTRTADETITGQKRFGVAPLMPSDICFWMDGQSGRPALATWQASPATTDVTAVVQAAIATGLDIHFSPGTYLVSQSLHPKASQRLYGSGGAGFTPGAINLANMAEIRLTSGANCDLIVGDDWINYVRIENLYLNGNRTTRTAGYALVPGVKYQIFRRVSSTDYTTCGARDNSMGTQFTATSAVTVGTGDVIQDVGTTTSRGIVISDSASGQEAQWHITGTVVANFNGTGIYLGLNRRATKFSRSTVFNCNGYGIDVEGSDNNIDDTVIGMNILDGILLNNTVTTITRNSIFTNRRGIAINGFANQVHINGNSIDRSYREAIFCAGYNVSISGNYFHYNSQDGDSSYNDITVDGATGQASIIGNTFGSETGVVYRPGYNIAATNGGVVTHFGNTFNGFINNFGNFNSAALSVLANGNAAANGQLSFPATGAAITRNVADSNPVLYINQANSGGTGYLQTWNYLGAEKGHIDASGNLVLTGIIKLMGQKITYGTAAPITGTWAAGDLVFNSAPAAGQPRGWVCTAAGAPGTWATFEDASKAPLDSPTFTGTPAAPTAAADTTTTQLATTAFVLGQVATTTPVVTATGGTGVVGTSKKYARADHAHPKGDAVTVNGYGTSQSGAAVSCMVTDGNGNLGLGTTPDTWASANRAIQVGFSGALFASTSSTATSFANNVYDNGIARYRTSNAAALYQQSGAGHYWFNAPTGTAGAALTWALALSLDSTGALTPGIDNTQTCGSAAKRWSTLYAGTGTINTSDAREKTAVQVLTDAEISAASALSKEIGTYRFLSAIAEKGEAARFHVGMTVQRAIEIIQSFGLDPFKYGFICHDEWGADADTGTAAGDRYSFRPDELLLFIARGIEARLTVLENR